MYWRFCGSPNYPVFPKTFSLLVFLILVKQFIPRQRIFCFINNTNELRLVANSAFFGGKIRQGDKLPYSYIHDFERKQNGLELVCSFPYHRPLRHRPTHYMYRHASLFTHVTTLARKDAFHTALTFHCKKESKQVLNFRKSF